MSLHEIRVEWKYVLSYKTLKGLQKRIEQDRDMYPEHNDRFIITQTPEGRWTALVLIDRSTGGYVGRYGGFLKV